MFCIIIRRQNKESKGEPHNQNVLHTWEKTMKEVVLFEKMCFAILLNVFYISLR